MKFEIAQIHFSTFSPPSVDTEANLRLPSRQAGIRTELASDAPPSSAKIKFPTAPKKNLKAAGVSGVCPLR